MLPVKVLLFEKADPSLLSIEIELTGHLSVIIPLLARRRRKYIFLFFLEGKILASCTYVFNTKSTATRPIWVKFGQIVVLQKPCLRIFIPLFVLKLVDLFSTRSAHLFFFSDFICLEKKSKRTCQKSETWLFSQRCQEGNAVLIVLLSLFLEGVELNL